MSALQDRVAEVLASEHPFGELAGGQFPDWFRCWIARVAPLVAGLVEERRIETDVQLELVPRGSVVRSDAGTIACRFDGRNSVVFGDDRPFPWHKLALPAVVLWTPNGDQR